MLSVFGHYFHVETGAILYRENFVVEFAEEIDILVVYLSVRDWEDAASGGLGHFWLNLIDLFIYYL